MPDKLEQHYSQSALECMELAERTRDPEMKASLLGLAQKWLRLARGRMAARHLPASQNDGAKTTSK